MYRSYIAGSRSTRAIEATACAFVIFLNCGSLQAASAADVLPSMKYAPAARFAGAEDQRFQLLAGDADAGDDCLPLSSDAAVPGSVIVLAKADVDKKTVRESAVRKKGGATLIDAVPVSAPAAIGIAADGSRDWEIIISDKTLNATMARWAASAGWQLLWELPVDYAVEARTRVHGTFEEAVSIVARSMESAEIPMKAVFYQGNKVLRIMAKGSE